MMPLDSTHWTSISMDDMLNPQLMNRRGHVSGLSADNSPTHGTFCPSSLSGPCLTVPMNYGTVFEGVHRSSRLEPCHLAFLQARDIRTVMMLTPEPPPAEMTSLYTANDIVFQQHGLMSTKYYIPDGVYGTVGPLVQALLTADHPTLIHCNSGKHRTGIVVGCLRKVMGWPLPDIIEEYRQYAGTKARLQDIQLIGEFPAESIAAKGLRLNDAFSRHFYRKEE